MIQPRLHWALLDAGHFEVDYLLSLIGLFNIAGTIAHLKSNGDLIATFSGVQDILIGALKSKSFSDEQKLLVQNGLNNADRYLGIQSRKTILNAIDFVQEEVAKEATEDTNAS